MSRVLIPRPSRQSVIPIPTYHYIISGQSSKYWEFTFYGDPSVIQSGINSEIVYCEWFVYPNLSSLPDSPYVRGYVYYRKPRFPPTKIGYVYWSYTTHWRATSRLDRLVKEKLMRNTLTFCYGPPDFVTSGSTV